MPVVPDANVFVVLSTDKTELVSKNFAGPSSGFVSMLILGLQAETGGVGYGGVRGLGKSGETN